VQSLLQHTPSAQKFDRHCLAPVQEVPGSPFAVHCPFGVQKFPCAQSVSVVHFVRHAVVPQTNDPQFWVPAAGQLEDVPLQFAARVPVPLAHDAAEH